MRLNSVKECSKSEFMSTQCRCMTQLIFTPHFLPKLVGRYLRKEIGPSFNWRLRIAMELAWTNSSDKLACHSPILTSTRNRDSSKSYAYIPWSYTWSRGISIALTNPAGRINFVRASKLEQESSVHHLAYQVSIFRFQVLGLSLREYRILKTRLPFVVVQRGLPGETHWEARARIPAVPLVPPPREFDLNQCQAPKADGSSYEYNILVPPPCEFDLNQCQAPKADGSSY